MKLNLLKIAGITALVAGMAATPVFANENCDPGEIVIKFSHVTAAAGHPKGEFAAALAERINDEMNGVACMQVFPNSTLFDDNKTRLWKHCFWVMFKSLHLRFPSLKVSL